MIANLALFLFASLLLAAVIVASVGPVRLLAGFVAVPIMAAIIAVLAIVGWFAYRLHGG